MSDHGHGHLLVTARINPLCEHAKLLPFLVSVLLLYYRARVNTVNPVSIAIGILSAVVYWPMVAASN